MLLRHRVDWLGLFIVVVIVYSIDNTMFVSHLQSQDCVGTPVTAPETLNRQLVDHAEQLAKFDKNVCVNMK